jgi:hypothetical protein
MKYKQRPWEAKKAQEGPGTTSRHRFSSRGVSRMSSHPTPQTSDRRTPQEQPEIHACLFSVKATEGQTMLQHVRDFFPSPQTATCVERQVAWSLETPRHQRSHGGPVFTAITPQLARPTRTHPSTMKSLRTCKRIEYVPFSSEMFSGNASLFPTVRLFASLTMRN